MLRKVGAFISLDRQVMFLFAEACMYLGWARILKVMPFSKVSSALGIHMEETPLSYIEFNKPIIGRVSEAIQIVSQHTLWDSMCFEKSIAAMKMLERRRIESTLYFGTAKDKDGKLVAHAWLRSGPFYITGMESMDQFTVVSTFAKKIDEKNPKKGDYDA
ncbi:hypothetical protein ABH959_002471 [Bacillus sp. RC51]